MINAIKRTFEHSTELRRQYNEHFERWSRKYRLAANELAERCGVSTQYLAHIGRYGRIPGKPILLLLALNLEVPDPQEFLRAANVREPWPFETTIGLRPRSPADSGFISMNVDMQGFATAIREIVRAELRPQNVEQLLAGRALRIGLNRGQTFLFGDAGAFEGFFPELIRLLALSLKAKVEFVNVSHAQFSAKLHTGEIDVYGPVYMTPNRIGQALYTNPFCTVQLAALARERAATGLKSLPAPKSLTDLAKKEYVIAVHEESMSHHFAIGELQIPPERIVPCVLPEESIERIILSNIPRPAHVLLTDAPHATKIHERYPKETQILFRSNTTALPRYEDAIAIRPDWQPVATLLNEALIFLGRSGSMERLRSAILDPNDSRGVALT